MEMKEWRGVRERAGRLKLEDRYVYLMHLFLLSTVSRPQSERSDWSHRIVRAFYRYQLFRDRVGRRNRPKAMSHHVIENRAGIQL